MSSFDDDTIKHGKMDSFETKHLYENLKKLDDDFFHNRITKGEYTVISMQLKTLEQLNALNATMTNLLIEFRKVAKIVT